jgi:manganese/zinc/iron transport system permease protein
MSPDLVVILTGALVAIAGSALGAFLLLRRTAMQVDAISHSVLPGIVLAFWLSGGSRATLPALLGAAAFGLLTVYAVEALTRSGRVKEDAAIGMVFPALFSLGVLSITRFFDAVHLDLDAVLYGEIAFAPFNELELFGRNLGPESLWLMGAVAAVNVAFVSAFFKELKVTTFDPGLAGSLGLSPALVQTLLMTLVSITTVTAFQSVGAILILGFVVIPPATAYLLTDNLKVMVVGGAALGVGVAAGGYGAAVWLDLSVAGAMVSVAGLAFIAAFLASPRYGLVAGILRLTRQRQAVEVRHLLRHLHHLPGGETLGAISEALEWSASRTARAAWNAARRGWLERGSGRIRLTPAGRALAGAQERGGPGA